MKNNECIINSKTSSKICSTTENFLQAIQIMFLCRVLFKLLFSLFGGWSATEDDYFASLAEVIQSLLVHHFICPSVPMLGYELWSLKSRICRGLLLQGTQNFSFSRKNISWIQLFIIQAGMREVKGALASTLQIMEVIATRVFRALLQRCGSLNRKRDLLQASHPP